MTDDDRTDLGEQQGTDGGKKSGTTTKGQKRRKVNHACLYCRRSHMTCDEGRPCQRCIKRDIGHLCHDERKPPPAKQGSSSSVGLNGNSTPQPTIDTSTPSVVDSSTNPTPVQPPDGFPVQSTTQFAPTLPQSTPQWPLFATQPFGLPGTDSTLGSEFSVLSDFLQSLDNRGLQSFVPGSMMQESPQPRENMDLDSEQLSQPQQSPGATDYRSQIQMPSPVTVQSPTNNNTPGASTSATHNDPTEPLLPAATKTEKFLLTAADQEPGTRDERLARVIHAKYEAGLLRPYNYVKGYARLSRWMDHNMSNESKKQIIQPLSVLRPLVGFERYLEFKNRPGNHCCINILGVPRAKAADAERVARAECKAAGLSLYDLPPIKDATWQAELRGVVGDEEYFLVLLPDLRGLVGRLAPGQRVPMDLGRLVLADLVGQPGRANWKSCQMSQEEEEKMADELKEQFSRFEPGA